MNDDQLWSPEDHPGEILGVRRHADRCFHAAEEEVEAGYIVQGVLFPRDEIAEVRITPRQLPPCPAPPRRPLPPPPPDSPKS